MSDLNITIVQSDLHWEDIPANIEHLALLLEDVDPYTDLIILPEVFNTGFPVDPVKFAENESGPTIQWMKEMATRHDCVITGSMLFNESGKFYNRLIWMQPDGTYDHYSKRHVFTLGEEADIIQPGQENKIFKLKDWKIKPQVCYDLRFPVWAKNTYSDDGFEYDLLFYVANWPAVRSFVWRHLLVARALENQSYVVGVNRIGRDGLGHDYSGDSCLVNAKGQIVSDFKENAEQLKSYRISLDEMNAFRNKFNVGLDWDKFSVE